jgi:hypothetical protein
MPVVDPTFPYDPVPHLRNRWQVVHSTSVFGRWRYDNGKKASSPLSPATTLLHDPFRQVFVCGPPPNHSPTRSAVDAVRIGSAFELPPHTTAVLQVQDRLFPTPLVRGIAKSSG